MEKYREISAELKVSIQDYYQTEKLPKFTWYLWSLVTDRTDLLKTSEGHCNAAKCNPLFPLAIEYAHDHLKKTHEVTWISRHRHASSS